MPKKIQSMCFATYFANKEGGADYLIDEREVVSTESITVSIPTQGALVPTGSYYVTSFLMTEKSVESTNESGEKETLTGLVAIDNKKFSNRISYTNTKQPSAPQSVTLALAGNEVMKANWTAVDGAAGYAVTIYQKDDDDKWIDTGFGYDLKKSEDGQPAGHLHRHGADRGRSRNERIQESVRGPDL